MVDNVKGLTCEHCGKPIEFDAFIRKWVSGKVPPSIYGKAKRGTWKCNNDPAYPVRAHCPPKAVGE